MEKGPKNTFNTEIDPRKKDGQGLDYWAEGLLQNNLIGRKEYEEFIEKNNSKEEIMEQIKLPQLKHYGYFSSVEEIREKIIPREGDKFIIRCKSKKTGDIKRLIDADLDEVCIFGKELPGGFDEWDVEVKEFTETIAAGTIVVSPDSKTLVEMWKGPHYLVTTNCPKYHATFDPSRFDMRYHWDAPEGEKDLPEMQNYAIKALRYIFKNLKPRENEPIYIEYGVKSSGEVYFIEANDSTLLTGK
jgi:hypothetical protein